MPESEGIKLIRNRLSDNPDELNVAAEAVEKAVKSPHKPAFKDSEIVFSAGCDLMDLAAGGGIRQGLPSGKIINIVGDKSAGKTFIACEIIAHAYHAYGKNFKWEYDDCESGFTFRTKEMYGFEIMPEDKAKRRRSETVEKAYCNIRDFAEGLKPNEFGIYILDSLDGLTSEEQDGRADKRFNRFKKGEDKPMEGSYQMGKAKYLSQEFFPQLADLLENKNVLLVVISQVRDNVEIFSFKKYARAGGKALDFYCHSVFWLGVVQKIRRNKLVVGTIVRALLEKSKTPRPFRETEFMFYFDYGVDNIGSNLDYLFNLRTDDTRALKKEAQAITWLENAPDKNVTNLKSFIEDNDLVEAYKAVYKDFKKSDMLAFLESAETNPKHTEYLERFGTTYTRDELITHIEDNGLQAELTRRVREKWEANEEAAKMKRAPKFPVKT